MTLFHYYHPVEVRYSDLDPQGHLNNASYLTYFEQARINYIVQLGLWQGRLILDDGHDCSQCTGELSSASPFRSKIEGGCTHHPFRQ